MNATELLMRRRNVAEFIKADPVWITISRLPAPTPNTETGGYVAAPAIALPPQQGRIVLNKRRYTAGLVNSEMGEIPHTDYLLIMTYNKDVAVDDSFTWLGEHYEVTGRYLARQESILCSIDILGKKNRDAQ